ELVGSTHHHKAASCGINNKIPSRASASPRCTTFGVIVALEHVTDDFGVSERLSRRSLSGAKALPVHDVPRLASGRGREQACVLEIRSLLSAEPFDQNETFCRAPPCQAGFVL